jgi:hypothetical protein
MLILRSAVGPALSRCVTGTRSNVATGLKKTGLILIRRNADVEHSNLMMFYFVI